jgi:hypothetical protein
MKLTLRHLSLAIAVLFLQSAGAQSGPTSGLYRIISGSYIERSGSLGDSFSSLPNASQRFVRLLVDPDPQSYLVTMTFLGEDLQTVFSAMPCPPGGPISFSFLGSAYTDPMTFHVDPSPPPDEQQWSYTVSNSFNTLRIDGQVVALRRSCAEDQQFIHSNVVAVLVAPPRIRITEFSKDGALLFIQGPAGWTNVIEASTDLATWRPIGTNVMPYTLCPVCPYILFQDTASTNLVRRFYRCFEIQ